MPNHKVSISIEAYLTATINVNAPTPEMAVDKALQLTDFSKVDFDINDIDPDSLMVTAINGIPVSDDGEIESESDEDSDSDSDEDSEEGNEEAE